MYIVLSLIGSIYSPIHPLIKFHPATLVNHPGFTLPISPSTSSHLSSYRSILLLIYLSVSPSTKKNYPTSVYQAIYHCILHLPQLQMRLSKFYLCDPLVRLSSSLDIELAVSELKHSSSSSMAGGQKVVIPVSMWLNSGRNLSAPLIYNIKMGRGKED